MKVGVAGKGRYIKRNLVVVVFVNLLVDVNFIREDRNIFLSVKFNLIKFLK